MIYKVPSSPRHSVIPWFVSRTRRVFIKQLKVATTNFLLWLPTFNVPMIVKQPWKYFLVLMTDTYAVPKHYLERTLHVGVISLVFRSLFTTTFFEKDHASKKLFPLCQAEWFLKGSKKRWCTGPDCRNQRPVSVRICVKPWSMLLFLHAGRACMSPRCLIVLPQPSEQSGGFFGQVCRLTLVKEENPYFPPLCSPQKGLCVLLNLWK